MNDDLREHRIAGNRKWIDIGVRLSTLRRASGQSVQEVADLVDMAPVTVYRLEMGAATTTVLNLNRLAQLYGVSLDFVVNGPDEKESELDYRIAAEFRGKNLTDDQLQQVKLFTDFLLANQKPAKKKGRPVGSKNKPKPDEWSEE